jgi:hypothetical protein
LPDAPDEDQPFWIDYGGAICQWIEKGWRYLLGGAERETQSKSRRVGA